MDTIQRKRLEWIDCAKGICILFVLVSHKCGIPIIGRLIGAFYMPLFFVVSGYTQRETGWGYYKGKIATIIKKYFTYSGILLALWIFEHNFDSGVSIAELICKCIGICYSRN